MKKLILLILLVIVSFIPVITVGATEPTDTTGDETEPTPGATNDIYDRIYKEDGIWYGVLDVKSSNVFTVKASEIGDNINVGGIVDIYNSYLFFVEFSFTRSTKSLQSIDIEYTFSKYCPNVTCVFGGVKPAVTRTKTLTFDDEALGYHDPTFLEQAFNIGNSVDEVFGNGEIAESIDPNYDYVLNLDYHVTVQDITIASGEIPKGTIEFFRFTYILEDFEVDDVNVDIQAQYDNEVDDILIDDRFTIEEKQLLLEKLNLEYAEYVIEYDESITSLCLTENCVFYYVPEEDPNFDDPWNPFADFFNDFKSSILDFIFTVLILLVSAVTGGAFIYALIYYMINSTVKGSVSAVKITASSVHKSGKYWGGQMFNGTVFFFKTVGNAFKRK